MVVPNATATFDVLGGFTVQEKFLLRVYFDFHYGSQSLNQAVYGAWGLHVVTDDALAAVAVPDPAAAAEPESSWMWWQHFFQDTSQLEKLTIIGKTLTQRLIPNRSSLVFTLNNDIASDGNMEFSVNLRTLFEWR